MSYVFKEHTADIAVEVEAETLEKLMEDACLATMEVNAELDGIRPERKFEIKIQKQSPEKMLFDLLDEIIFLKDAEYSVFSKFEVNIDEDMLICNAYGEEIDPERMKMGVDVKAVTYNNFEVKEEDGWKAHFILDI